MLVKINWLREKIINTLKDFPIGHAEVSADALIWAEATGKKDQGIIKLAGSTPFQNTKPKGDVLVENRKCVSIVDGNNNLPIYTSYVAMQEAIANAQNLGIGAATVNHATTSNTTQSYYLNKISQQDMIGFMCSRSDATQTAFGSVEAFFGTNPLGFSFPTNNKPLFLDFSTSAMLWSGLILAEIRGESLPENVAINSKGEITIDPSVARNGAILPRNNDFVMSSLAMTVELLAGVLAGAEFGKYEEETNWGAFLLVLDPEIFCGLQLFKDSVDSLLDKIKNSKTAKDKTIRIPSENSWELFEQSQKTGMVDIDEILLKNLNFI